jgi:hypothetical protein
MRALFGLVSLLVVVLIVVWLFANYNSGVSQPARKAQNEAAQMAGTDVETGGRASESADVDLIKTSSGKPDSILVTSVKAGGAYERYFGLKKDDAILQIGPLSVKDHPAISSTEDASNSLLDAYQKKQPLVVVRDGQQITLPQAGQAQQQPANNQNKGSGDPLQQQLEGIGARRGL